MSSTFTWWESNSVELFILLNKVRKTQKNVKQTQNEKWQVIVDANSGGFVINCRLNKITFPQHSAPAVICCLSFYVWRFIQFAHFLHVCLILDINDEQYYFKQYQIYKLSKKILLHFVVNCSILSTDKSIPYVWIEDNFTHKVNFIHKVSFLVVNLVCSQTIASLIHIVINRRR